MAQVVALSASMPSASDFEVPPVTEEEASSPDVGSGLGHVTCFGQQNELQGTLSPDVGTLRISAHSPLLLPLP